MSRKGGKPGRDAGARTGSGPGDAPSSSRRVFLKGAAGAGAAAALSGCIGSSDRVAEFLQNHYKRLSPEDVRDVIARLERQYSAEYGADIEITNTPPIPGVTFAYALDLSRCIGCRRCVYACVEENNQSRDPQIHWITVLEMEKEHGVDLHHSTPYYDAEEVPREGHFYMPTACQQCENPPCVKVCPIGATWKEPDGIVTIDYNWCFGCRCCITACPYGARHFNWADPKIPSEEINTHTHYLGNRPRYRGVVEKCTFCVQRTREGRYPACVEVCPVGARKFGNLLDPRSEIRYIIENKRVYIFKEELNTRPKFFYYYGI